MTEKGFEEDQKQFVATVPRHLVHRRSVSEVFLTGVEDNGQNTYTVFAQWPRWHPYFGADVVGLDSALVIETMRQATILVAHSQLNVALGSQFLMSDISLAMDRDFEPDPAIPTEARLSVVVSDLKMAGESVSAFRTQAVFWRGESRIAMSTAGARIAAARTYARMRAGRVLSIPKQMVMPSMPASQVGCRSRWNIVLGRPLGPRSWTLHVDCSNPTFFDHPLDHVPGVLLIEAVRQALRVAVGDPVLDFDSVETEFLSITELDTDAVVVVDTLEAGGNKIYSELSVVVRDIPFMRATCECTSKVASVTDEQERDTSLRMSDRPSHV